MEGIEIKGDFIIVNNKTTIKLNDIVSIKPQSIVIADQQTGKILSRDFAKILVRTTHELIELLFTSDAKRDEILKQFNEALIMHQSSKTPHMPDGKITINVSDSNNVNIVSNSKNVSITADTKRKLEQLVSEIKSELGKINIPEAQKIDIIDCVEDIQTKVEEEKEIKQYSIKNLIGMTSDISQISSFAIAIGQLLGYIPQ